MCGVCGCGNDNKVFIISEINDMNHLHEHEHHHGLIHTHTHEHDHSHHDHTHHHSHSEKTVIELEKDILHKNQLFAERNRGYFSAKKMLTFNLVSSPGSGKTTLLEKTLYKLKDTMPCYVIEGDQQTTNDALRIKATDTPVVQVNTGQGCHLESDMIQKAISKLDPKEKSILFIENVGNLVCPAMFDLGENIRAVIMSVTEGDDKPIKYPDAFHSAQVCIINKIDLLPYVDFDIDKAKDYAMKVNPKLKFFEVSATSEEGVDQWCDWIKEQLN